MTKPEMTKKPARGKARPVHLTVAEDPQMASESIGDAFLKTVIISVRR